MKFSNCQRSYCGSSTTKRKIVLYHAKLYCIVLFISEKHSVALWSLVLEYRLVVIGGIWSLVSSLFCSHKAEKDSATCTCISSSFPPQHLTVLLGLVPENYCVRFPFNGFFEQMCSLCTFLSLNFDVSVICLQTFWSTAIWQFCGWFSCSEQRHAFDEASAGHQEPKRRRSVSGLLSISMIKATG